MRLGEILHILLKKYVSILVLALLSISMIAQDTIPTRSFEKETYQDLIAPTTSMTLEQPDNIVTSVDYDPVSGGYVIRTRMGDIDVATPYLMTAEEYKDYSERQFIQNYWQSKIAEVEHNNESKFDITDMKFNIGPADKIFGPGGVQLKLQGSAELLFGFKHQYVNNPALTLRARNNNIFDFDQKIQVNVNGKVGERLNFNMNYNTEASFSFDQQNLKLAFKGQEDDIIQSIEAGNVSLNLNSNLIRGSQALFGIKTELKFGKLRIQALMSQQNSESQSVSSQGGAQMTKFEIAADSYDENKHFFLNYYFRDHYEDAMAALPYVASGVTINRIEVWVTNKRGNYDQARNVVAFTDLGESENKHISNPEHFQATPGFSSHAMPDNRANKLYASIKDQPQIRDIQQVNAYLQTQSTIWGITGGEDYEKIESARLLSSNEYTLNTALGFISLKSALNQDEVLAVAYEYTYAGQVYQVGEFSTDLVDTTQTKAPNLILKMLKASNNAPHPRNAEREAKGETEYGTWDLMLKNVYALGASQMSSDKFELYIMYRNDSIGTELQYLPDGPIKGKQLLRVMNLDKLDTKNNPYPDGRFDYVEGYTALSSSGRIIFPVLEPFGAHLSKVLNNDPTLVSQYCFTELYDSTLVMAQEMSEKNKFTLQGKYKGSNGSEIRLNAMNVPRGSVVVTAGGATLVENVDYTVDYTMGTVTILNQSILESGTNVEVRLENQSMFSIQRKSLYGAHLEYEFNKDFQLGGTIMHLRERPLTTKVNTGSEPLANTIWGLNLNYRTELMGLTALLDKIPWIQATQPSMFQINAEFAHLIPGHTNDVGSAGTAYMDDFESTKTSIDLHYPNYWFLASTPYNVNGNKRFHLDAKKSNSIDYNRDRALLTWYVVDPIFGHPQTNTPQHIKNDVNAMSDHRTRIVYEQEIYPNKGVLPNEDTRMSILNLSFYPKERGPYNISADEFNSSGELTEPSSRWGGMMRRLDNTDFETSNIEYIEFWLMDPLLTNQQGFTGGDLYIDLGDVSEDILRDGKKSFEHGLPLNEETNLTESTIWGRIPKTTSTTVAFSNEDGAREKQDIGLNGLTTEEEFLFEYNGTKPYADFVTALRNKVTNPTKVAEWNADPYSPFNDPAGDNYHYYRGNDLDDRQVPILERYKRFNGTEGNSPEPASNATYGSASTLQPDIEDVNADNTMNEYEKYFEYRVSLRPGDLEVGKQHIAEKKIARVKLKNGEYADVAWYQFKIPLRGQSMQQIGGIRNFKSIRFMRMYMTGFEEETHLRFATLSLVRGEWRTYTKGLYKDATTGRQNAESPNLSTLVDVQAVNIEENSNRTPVNYVLPPGISRQTDPGQAQLIAQNEQAMVLRVHNLEYNDAKAVYKNIIYDLRNYKRLLMFIHAEALETDFEEQKIKDGDLACFIRLGSDMTNNYYEYEIPLKVTPPGVYNNDDQNQRATVWPKENQLDVPFEVFTKAKSERNRAKRAGSSTVGNTIPYVIYDTDNDKPENKITVMGNPTLENIEHVMIGVRNRNNHKTGGVNGEVWINELRMSEFNEEGGVAAMANMSLGLSDIGQVNVAGRLETAGYGSIESNVLNRNMDNVYQISVSAALEAGRLFPEQAKLQIPLYVSYTKDVTSPKYDPLDTDVKLEETLDTYETKEEKDSIRQRANTSKEAISFSMSNMKVNVHSKKKDMFYDPANFTISASYNKQTQKSPELESDVTSEQKGSFNYAYSFNPKPWEPFKKVEKVKKVKFLNEFNLYYLPQSWAFSTNMLRTFAHLKMRNFNQEVASSNPISATLEELTFSKDFTWDRNFDFKYDLTKNLKFTFHTAMNSTVDEGYYTPEIIKDYAFSNDLYEGWKDTIQRNMGTWGKPYNYQQVFTASWNVPFNRIPYLEALTASASYNATYTWNRTAQRLAQEVNPGNTISSTAAWQADGQINFETLYGKSKYWKQLNQRFSSRGQRRAFRPKNYSETVNLEANVPVEIVHRLNSEALDVIVMDSKGKKVNVKVTTDGTSKIQITSKKSINDVSVKISTRNPNQRTASQLAGDFMAYFGTMVRRLQVTYRHTNSLTMPGFSPQVGFMGQSHIDNAYAPGWDFAFGFISDDYVQKAKDRGWLYVSNELSQPALKANTSDFDVKLVLEPFPGFKVQVNGKRYNAQSSSLLYSVDSMGVYALQDNMTGSYNITQVAIGTAFAKIGAAEDNFSSEVFTQFLANRNIMANRIQQRYANVLYPSDGFMTGGDYAALRGQTYDASNGGVNKNSADVLVPAFFAAYTGRDIHNVKFNPFLSILNILPNWSVTFDGLGRIPWLRERFKSITLTHAYTCKYAIGSYSSYSTWVGAAGDDKTIGFTRDVVTGNPVPSTAFDISSVNLTESFSPLIGLNMTMKNSLAIKAEYRKQRTLALNVTSIQITEGHTNEFVIGAGYTVKDLSFVAKSKGGKQKKVSNDLKINVDVSYKNIMTLLRKVEENITQASSGNKVFGIKLSADYVLSQKVSLQLYYDHEGTTPLISSSYPIKSDNVGINVKLMLTR